MNTMTDIFTPESRAKLTELGDHSRTIGARMAVSLNSTLGHVFAGIDNDLEPAHRQARKDARRAKTAAGRKANRARRSR